MKFLSEEQKKAYEKAVAKKYKAVVFDLDGTLTPFGKFTIPKSLLRVIDEIPKETYVALCTGRRLDYIKREFGNIIHNPSRLVFCENGCLGYAYDYENEEFEKIHEAKWPSERITPDALEAFIKDKFGPHMHVSTRSHSVVAFYHSWFYISPRFVRKISGGAAKKLRKLIKNMGVDDVLEVKDSGIGNVLLPKGEGKGSAMKSLSKYLGIGAEKILTIGDQANPGENDEDFLNGENSISFTVGRQTKNTYPLPVLNEKGKKLWGPRGTEKLLKDIFF